MKYCPTCLRPEALFGECTNSDFGIPCPEPVEENPETDINLSCGPCGMNRIVPVRHILSGATRLKLPHCKRDTCACTVVPHQVSGKSATLMVVDDPVMPEVKAHAEAVERAMVAGDIQEPAPEEPSVEEPTKGAKAKKASAKKPE